MPREMNRLAQGKNSWRVEYEKTRVRRTWRSGREGWASRLCTHRLCWSGEGGVARDHATLWQGRLTDKADEFRSQGAQDSN